MELYIHSFVTSTLEADEWSALGLGSLSPVGASESPTASLDVLEKRQGLPLASTGNRTTIIGRSLLRYTVSLPLRHLCFASVSLQYLMTVRKLILVRLEVLISGASISFSPCSKQDAVSRSD